MWFNCKDKLPNRDGTYPPALKYIEKYRGDVNGEV